MRGCQCISGVWHCGSNVGSGLVAPNYWQRRCSRVGDDATWHHLMQSCGPSLFLQAFNAHLIRSLPHLSSHCHLQTRGHPMPCTEAPFFSSVSLGLVDGLQNFVGPSDGTVWLLLCGAVFSVVRSSPVTTLVFTYLLLWQICFSCMLMAFDRQCLFCT